MIRVYYNPSKRVFVAQKSNGTLIKVSKDFGEVDIAANIEGDTVEYDIDSFPVEIKLKVAGKDTKSYNDSPKFIFMRLIFSFTKFSPPDVVTRKIARVIHKHKLMFLKTVYVDDEIYIITYSKSYGFVVFRVRKTEHGWSSKTIQNLKKLPREVRKVIDSLKPKK